MALSKKPLHPYEQSMLLAALLFDAKNLPGLLAFLPDEQSQRIRVAEEKFRQLPRDERITQVVLELRRLLLIDENRIDWIHPSWIDDALAKEPPYLRSIITQSIADGTNKPFNKASNVNEVKIPLTLIFSAFAIQLTKTPQKIAIFDPTLMRLQSLKDDSGKDLFFTIGTTSLEALAQTIDSKRLKAMLRKKGHIQPTSLITLAKDHHPFGQDDIRGHYLKELIKFSPTKHIDCAVFAGLLTLSLYLLAYKPQWQRAIALGLPIKLGQQLDTLIKRAQHLVISDNDHALISPIVLMALDELKL